MNNASPIEPNSRPRNRDEAVMSATLPSGASSACAALPSAWRCATPRLRGAPASACSFAQSRSWSLRAALSICAFVCAIAVVVSSCSSSIRALVCAMSCRTAENPTRISSRSCEICTSTTATRAGSPASASTVRSSLSNRSTSEFGVIWPPRRGAIQERIAGVWEVPMRRACRHARRGRRRYIVSAEEATLPLLARWRRFETRLRNDRLLLGSRHS